ncbi:hypothetical protein RvY_12580-4 [Ramazzottius varieornatus]|uniref:Nuclear receptor domain-containing protein n=1 Tax=Ramazzottius varieornatus TaxID=947166 RepID=A0A1D1VP66_RAMVA|nr:hypothetical protein RvY_12580-4 [Ramazzottius varieornatus]
MDFSSAMFPSTAETSSTAEASSSTSSKSHFRPLLPRPVSSSTQNWSPQLSSSSSSSLASLSSSRYSNISSADQSATSTSRSVSSCRRLPSKRPSAGRDFKGNCTICGQKASGVHYGATACEGCKVSHPKFKIPI